MTGSQNQNNVKREYDLEERCAKFAEDIIALCQRIKITPLNSRIITQLIGSGGSVGANYGEACEAESKKDFVHKMGIAKKEAKESKHWLRLLAKTNPEEKTEISRLYQEAHNLLMIFASSINTCRKSK